MKEKKLYPLKFTPILQDKIWGGSKLKSQFNKPTESNKCGESWEISGYPGFVSVVSNGFLAGNNLNELIEIYMGDLIGDTVHEKFGNAFPLLIKFIDAKEDLSLQVHPYDELAEKQFGSFGKTEMWYIMAAEKDSRLAVGFNKDTDKTSYKEYVDEGKLEEIIDYKPVQEGEAYFIPAGRVHAICAGTVLAEIQQSSDATIRIYDYNRTDAQGNKRELHTDFALEAINFGELNRQNDYRTTYPNESNKSNDLISCEYFTSQIIPLQGKINKDYADIDSFVIFMSVEGNAVLEHENVSYELNCGESMLIPAEVNEITLQSDSGAKILEVYIK